MLELGIIIHLILDFKQIYLGIKTGENYGYSFQINSICLTWGILKDRSMSVRLKYLTLIKTRCLIGILI